MLEKNKDLNISFHLLLAYYSFAMVDLAAKPYYFNSNMESSTTRSGSFVEPKGR